MFLMENGEVATKKKNKQIENQGKIQGDPDVCII